jgi:tripartite ATP-independent transporter DctM subunit
MPRKIINATGVFLLSLLAVFPIAFRLVAELTGISILSADLVQVNLVFMFAGIAGIITSLENKQLNLGVINEALPYRIKRYVDPIQTVITTAILSALFLAAFSEFFMVFKDGEKVWGVPLKVVFAALPAMYFIMVAIPLKKHKSKIATIVGIAIGLVIASGPLSGILYYIFHLENLSVLSGIFNFWMLVASKLLWPLVILLVLAAAFGAPIFIVLAGIAYIAFSQGGGYVEMIPLESYGILTDKSIAAIPLFTLAGLILAEGSAGRRLLDVVKNSVGWLRGGPVIAAVIVATFFTTFTGASGVTILALGTLLTVILTGSGYSRDNAESLVTASGSIGMLFPPSLAIIIYGSTNIFSVDIYELFKGAFLPGVLMAIAMIVLGIMRDKSSVRMKFSPRDLGSSVYHGIGELLLPIGIVVGYFSGFLSLIETAAFTACYAFVLEVFVRRDFSLRDAYRVILKGIPIAGGVLVIIGAAKGLAYFMIDAGVPNMLTDLVLSFVHSKYVFLLLLNLLLLVVGCLMDLYSAILVVSPLIIPVAESFGIDPVHTGVIFLTNLALGFLTPPVGMNLFIASYTFDKPIMKVVKSIMPFLIAQFAILMLVTYVPWFTMVLVGR